MSFPKSFLDELKARIRVSDVVGRKVKLTRRGREFVGLSPFNNEKSPSFTVNDDKQFWHCFSSGEHGDVIKFLEKTENLSFLEAVERLAGEAGMEMPQRDPRHVERERKASTLIDVMEMAVEFFQRNLYSPQGVEALGYLRRRGLSDEIIQEFRLGYSFNSRTSLMEYLKSKGISIDQMADVGLIISGEDIRQPYDRFRNRVMFPIADARGRTVGFGGRTLDADGKPKYLNSPETALFHKGDVLFNFEKARKPAYEAGNVVVVEGYMDAISLYAAGLKYVVAALGTAITERQITELWRLGPEPVICLDGDAAGQRAASRLIDRALPLLKSGHALRFSYLPGGNDPDDFVKLNGLDAMIALVNNAKSFADVLYERETQFTSIDTPERKAQLSKRFDELVFSLKDEKVQKFYRQMFNLRLSNLFWNFDRSRVKGDLRLAANDGAPRPVKELEDERVLLGMLVEHPDLFDLTQEDVQRAYFVSPAHAYFRDELMRILLLPSVSDVVDFYKEISDSFFPVLDVVHGEASPEKHLPRGHRFYERFPIARLHPDSEFLEECLQHYLGVQALKAVQKHREEIFEDYLEDVSDRQHDRFVAILDEIEHMKKRLDSEAMGLVERASRLRVMRDTQFQATFQSTASALKSTAA